MSAEREVRQLFASWGLEVGRAVTGWTVVAIDVVERHREGATARVSFARDGASLRVCIARDPRHPAGTGPIALSHEPLSDPALGKVVVELMKRLGAWLKMHEDGAKLLAILDPLTARRAQFLSAHKDATPERPPSAQPYVVVHDAPPLDPALRAPDDDPVIDFELIEFADLARYPDALREMHLGERGGIVVRGVYAPDEMAEVVSRLERAGAEWPQMELPRQQRSHFFGLCLEICDAELTEYLPAAARFREKARELFQGMVPFEQRIEGLFRALSGGRPVRLAQYPDGRWYTPATIRILPEGSQLAPHCGNEMYDRPSYTHLNTFVDGSDQLSYFLTLQEPEEGGGLIIYSLEWKDVDLGHVLHDRRSNVGEMLGRCRWMEVRPRAGDVLMFDGGRWLHRVDWVRGARTRWTMGGFLMFDRPGDNILYFA